MMEMAIHINDNRKKTDDKSGVGTGADPGFNASTMHQQNPNYRPFRQHLRSRCSLTRGRGRGGYRTQVSVTKLGHRSVIITLRRVLRNNTH
jgi:hypothetical protein